MAISKKQVIESIQAMPGEEFTDIGVLLERIMLLNKIEAEKKITKGKIYTTDKPKKSYQNGFLITIKPVL